MTNIELLAKVLSRMTETMTPTEIAGSMGWSMPTYYSRIGNRSEWTASEIVAFTRLAKIDKPTRDAIFLGENVS